MKRIISATLALTLLLLVAGCAGMHNGVEPTAGFQLQSYMGKWYEVARLDHPFERGLTNVTTTYTPRDDGGADITNRGLDPQNNQWSQSKGKAYLAREPDVGILNVYFLGPFKTTYVIFERDSQYQYAFVTGHDRQFLWLLSRTAEISPQLKTHFINQATLQGFDPAGLIWVDQSENTARLRDAEKMQRDATEQLPE